MKKQITRVSIAQTAKVSAAIYFVMTIPFVLLMMIPMMFLPSGAMGMSMGMMIAAPFLYALFGFIFTAIGALVYNLVASKIGGFEFTVSDVA